jgi:hypothetical protein
MEDLSQVIETLSVVAEEKVFPDERVIAHIITDTVLPELCLSMVYWIEVLTSCHSSSEDWAHIAHDIPSFICVNDIGLECYM